MALLNVWHLRKVAETSTKPCDICYKPTTTVLITPDSKDFFYICQGHLNDRGFASPIVDDADIAAKKRKEEMDREIELVKKEYEERLKKKKKPKDKKEKGSEKGKDNKNEDLKATKADDDDAKMEKEKNDEITAITSKQAPAPSDEGPRIYALHKVFFQKRLDRIRNAEIAKRNRERLRSPNYFPSVPNSLP